MENQEFTISERKQNILLDAVERYIDNAIPITSSNVQENSFKNLSSATLRNELNALEELGYLKQLHTSGGRIPTTKAYRFYVNNLFSNGSIDAKKFGIVKDRFTKRSAYLKEVLNDLAKYISNVTSYPTFVVTKGYQELIIKGVNIIPLVTGQGLVLFQTDAGLINNTISLSQEVTEENCKDASKFLTASFYNKTIKEIFENIDEYSKSFNKQIDSYQNLFNSLIQILEGYVNNGMSFLTSSNTTKLLEKPEYKDINNAKKFLNILENEEEIKNIMETMDKNNTNDIVFTIGEENLDKKYSDYSIIQANYTLGNGVVTKIGVLGPERMDYAKIASALKYVVDEMKKS